MPLLSLEATALKRQHFLGGLILSIAMYSLRIMCGEYDVHMKNANKKKYNQTRGERDSG